MERTIGVLAVQGAFREHLEALKKLGVRGVEIRKKSDLMNHSIDGLILPGGESTVMGKLLRELDLFEPLKAAIEEGMPVLGTCAGLILLAKSLGKDSTVHFGTMDITVVRNGYGRQLGSFSTPGDFKGIGTVPMVFIRAPYIEQVSDKVEVLSMVDGRIVAARQDSIVVTAFHPELTEDLSIHRYFLSLPSSSVNEDRYPQVI
ncbi:MAG TPA: pyridoxal 5'-phosphate synthase glutaminase subunit PdxT [Clostridiaceae bacterium]|nr:pyridoxal 5'-phosphate synthase glutaminase subunit PdxT [Clostridiaceae bacterium]